MPCCFSNGSAVQYVSSCLPVYISLFVPVCAVYAAMVSKYERLMGSIVATDMDFNQLDEFLKAQMKKKEARLVMCYVQDDPHGAHMQHAPSLRLTLPLHLYCVHTYICM